MRKIAYIAMFLSVFPILFVTRVDAACTKTSPGYCYERFPLGAQITRNNLRDGAYIYYFR